MKEYKTNEDLIEYLSSKGVTISDKSEALQKMERYTYYSIVNTYKSIFKDEDGNYFNNVAFYIILLTWLIFVSIVKRAKKVVYNYFVGTN